MEKIVLLGSGGHAKSVVDTIEQCGLYEIIGFLEVKEKQDFFYKNYQVIGTDDDLELLYSRGVKYAFVTIGYMGKPTSRVKLYEKLKKAKYTLPVIIDSTACVAENAIIEEGSFIGKGVIVNADVHIGKMCIINTGSIIEHECRIDDYSHIAVGTVLCGAVSIGKASFIGSNSTVIQGINIGKHAIVGAGSVVVKEVPDKCTSVGNPSQIIKVDV